MCAQQNMTQDTHNSDMALQDTSNALLEYLRILNGSSDHLHNLEIIFNDLCSRFQVQQAYIVSIDQLTSTLNLEITYGEGWDEDITSRVINLEDHICSLVASTSQVVFGNIPELYTSDSPLFPESQSVIALPIIFEQRLAGIIVLFFPGSFNLSESDISDLTDLSLVFGSAIRNIDYIKEVEISRAEWFQTFQSLSDGLAIARDDQVIRRCNKAFIDLIDVPREQLIGISLSDLLSITYEGNDSRIKRFEVNESTKTGNFVEFKDIKEDQTFVLNITPTINNGHFAWLFFLRNMTEQRAIEVQLIQSDKLAALGEMIAGVAHEINNPLTTIMGQSELLGLSKDLVKSQKSSKLILHEAHRAARIVKNLLIFSRSHLPEKVPVIINELIEQTLELWNYQIKVSNIEIDKYYNAQIPSILVDYYQIQQVIFNLIQNSQQAIASENKPGSIRIHTDIINDRFVRIVFEDNGPGIPAEHLKKIFNPFFTTKTVGKGTGLGLSITYGIITAHGGTITCQSEANKGTIFIIDLPIDSEGTPMVIDTEETELPSLPPHKIVVIDDETGILNFIKEALENKGHQVSIFADGGEALQYIKNHDFDVVFCDIKMPLPSGMDIFHSLSDENKKKLIFITGDLVNLQTKQFVDKSNRPCVMKPFTSVNLIKALLELSDPKHFKPSIQ